VRERGKKVAGLVDDESRKIGPLAKTMWWRVVLDEAQFVRNRNTVASINIAALDTTHRWILSGTPVTNALCVRSQVESLC
jgi:SNF2 family DNA or RNA helicase